MRTPVAAGRFYPAASNQLSKSVRKKLSDVKIKSDMLNVVVPHAGYVYSGQTAAYSFKALREADTYVIVGPCHFIPSALPAVTSQDWQTPLGVARLDREFISALEGIEENDAAHERDHAIEVQLPFLQVLRDDFEIVPVAIGDQTLQSARQLSAAIDRAIEETGRRVAVLASSDLTHFETKPRAEESDRQIYTEILEMNVEKFYEKASRGSVCGFAPIVVAMTCQGVSKAELLDYSTSAAATGDTSNVVGYVSVGFSK
ncbi:MAG: AmmeMemoRadiSam system protein B [bacterium]